MIRAAFAALLADGCCALATPALARRRRRLKPDVAPPGGYTHYKCVQ